MKEHQLVENVYSPTWEQRTMESYCLMQKLMLVAVGFGAAGRRCMALSTEIFVGDSKSWEEKLVERAKVLKVDIGTDPQADLGPVISKQGPNSCWMEELLCFNFLFLA
ncbi:methylmalonate-semialdehyde dehydrogenase [acylating], mitochondrial [Olea europaea subsp. europaea]|uniref:Methylmalonate-semialdehyde dehydrogenase [acylating], mitochondrial n=1 Tax=Olea europaea subsp. europaea TaxID=158383 RepID=A0A8S0QI31_OLEEU|nr:methylmalonate-semialdehyde dehydrogenase [acylating], mitochondrial [Olea europaea subsp. europaea]